MFPVITKEIPSSEEEKIQVCCHQVDERTVQLVHAIDELVNPNTINGIKDGKIYPLNPKDILYIEATENKTFLYLENDFYESRLKLYELEARLAEQHFLRVSKSFLLHLTKIESVRPYFNGRFEAILTNKEKIIISRQYVKDLKKVLGV